MNMLKMTTLSVAMIASLGLVGCQTSQAMQDEKPRHQKGERFHKKGERGHAGLTPQQMQAFDQACDGKIGQIINVTAGEKTFTGQCQVSFLPEKHPSDKKHSRFGMNNMAEKMGFHDKVNKKEFDREKPAKFEKMTAEQKAKVEAKRAEFEAKMQKHQAFKQSADQACQTKIGEKISLKFDDKTVTGECKVKFKFDHPQLQKAPAM